MKRILCLAALLVLAAVSSAQNFVVRFTDGTRAGDAARDSGAMLLEDTWPAPFALFENGPGLDALRADPRVMWVEPEAEVTAIPGHRSRAIGGTIPIVWDRVAAAGQNDRILHQIRWNEAIAQTGAQTARVAVIDTGLTPYTHLWQRVVAQHNLVEPGMPAVDLPNGLDENENGTADEGAGHGSMVAGVVNLVAPRAELVIIRAADDEGESTSWRIMRAVIHAVMDGAQVVNISLGTQRRLSTLECIVEWAQQRGVLLVAPVGNNAEESVLDPARIPGALCVAGLDLDDRKAPFSSFHGRVDVSAPSTSVASLWWDGSIACYSGTSFAAPLAAGAAALAIQHASGPIGPDALARMIRQSGRNIDTINPLFTGMLGTALNVGAAAQGAGSHTGYQMVIEGPGEVKGGETVQLIVTLNQPAAKDIWLQVRSTDASVLAPQWIKIEAGQSCALFDLATYETTAGLEVWVCVWNDDLYAAHRLILKPKG